MFMQARCSYLNTSQSPALEIWIYGGEEEVNNNKQQEKNTQTNRHKKPPKTKSILQMFVEK